MKHSNLVLLHEEDAACNSTNTGYNDRLAHDIYFHSFPCRPSVKITRSGSTISTNFSIVRIQRTTSLADISYATLSLRTYLVDHRSLDVVLEYGSLFEAPVVKLVVFSLHWIRPCGITLEQMCVEQCQMRSVFGTPYIDIDLSLYGTRSAPIILVT